MKSIANLYPPNAGAATAMMPVIGDKKERAKLSAAPTPFLNAVPASTFCGKLIGGDGVGTARWMVKPNR